jgi:hypothetical protein
MANALDRAAAEYEPENGWPPEKIDRIREE